MRISDWSSDVCSSDLHQRVDRRPGAIEITDCPGLYPKRIFERADTVLPAAVGVTDHLAFRGGQIGAIVALGECCLDVLDIVGDALRRPQQLACLLNLLLQRRQRRNRSEEHTSELQSL